MFFFEGGVTGKKTDKSLFTIILSSAKIKI